MGLTIPRVFIEALNKFLSFGSYKIHISEEEYQSLVDAYENFVKENGVRYGFVAKVLLPKC